MLKRIVFFLLATICLPVFANTKNEFKNALDSFNYQVTVEWDQKDHEFLKLSVSEFSKAIKSLKQAGLTATEVREVLQEKAVDAKTIQQLELLMSANKFNSPEEIVTFLNKNHSNFYQRGASWDGHVWMVIGFWAAAAAFLVAFYYLVIDEPEYICTERSTVQTCHETQDCMTYDEYGSCVSWGSYYESCSYACVNGYWEED